MTLSIGAFAGSFPPCTYYEVHEGLGAKRIARKLSYWFGLW